MQFHKYENRDYLQPFVRGPLPVTHKPKKNMFHESLNMDNREVKRDKSEFILSGELSNNYCQTSKLLCTPEKILDKDENSVQKNDEVEGNECSRTRTYKLADTAHEIDRRLMRLLITKTSTTNRIIFFMLFILFVMLVFLLVFVNLFHPQRPIIEGQSCIKKNKELQFGFSFFPLFKTKADINLIIFVHKVEFSRIQTYNNML